MSKLRATIKLERCEKHNEWYSSNCSECMAIQVEIDTKEQMIKEGYCKLPKVKLRGLTDEEIINVNTPCMGDDDCPFAIADEPAYLDNGGIKCQTCEDREIARAQRDKVKADNLGMEFEEE